MDLSLRPTTLQALRQFRGRYNALLWRRGWLVLLVAALLMLAAIALLDRARLLPDVARPWVSVAAYATAAFAAWRTALRFWHSAKDPATAARRAEAVAPELREKLLAAVELAGADPASVKDSPEFRAKLQDEVASLVKGVDWKARQPAMAVVPWVRRLALVAVVIAGLCAVPRLHFPGFLARAALPFANLERPSSVRITVEQPTGDRSLAPIASEVPVVVRIEGDAVEVAELEFGELSATARRMELARVSEGRFEAMLPVGQTDVRFRVHAADGLSAWHLLEARARPRVVVFEKTLQPPAYTGLPQSKKSEDHGDLEALDGSQIKLSLRCNQPVKTAKVVMDPDLPIHPDAPKAVLTAADASVVELTMPIDGKAESWTLRLVAAETEFSNDESESWRITVLPDLPPVVVLLQPAEAQISALADETIRLAGTASDDVGLAKVEIQHRINGEKWESHTLAEKAGLETAVQHTLPLGALQVQAGDTIQVRLFGTDLKGQTAESASLRIMILDQTVDPQRKVWAAEQARLAQLSQDLSETTRTLSKEVSELQKNVKKDSPEAQTQLAKAKQQLEQTRQQADDLWEQLKKAAQVAPTALDAAETQQLGQRLTHLRQTALKTLEEGLAKPVDPKQTETLKRAASEIYSDASTVADAARVFTADDASQLASQVAQQSARHQMQLKDQSLQANRDATLRPKWQEQQRAAMAATAELTEQVDAIKPLINGGQQRQLEQMQKQITEAQQDLTEGLDGSQQPAKDPAASVTPQAKSPEHLYGSADNLAQRLLRTAELMKSVADEASRRAADMRQRLQQADNPALAALDQARSELAQATALAKNPPKNDRPSKDGLTPQQRAEQKLADAAKQLQDQAELREQNPLTNTGAALDENRASRAADKIMKEAAEAGTEVAKLEATKAKADALAQVTRTLAAENTANEAKRALDEAAARQAVAATQPNSDELRQAAEAAAQAADQLKQLPQALRRTEALAKDAPLQQLAQQASDQARNAAQQIKDQARQPNPNPTPTPQLAEAQQKADQVATALAAQATQARGQLAELAPKVSEMMKQVATDLGQTKDKTQEAAQQAEAEKPVAEVAEKAQAIQPEAEANAESMSALQAALRQEANAAQLADENQRQLARTADVALEQMRQKSPQISKNLQTAAQAQASKPQAAALNQAAQAQQSTMDALQALAQQFGKMEAGEAVSQEALAELSKMEEQLGVQQPLDEAYKAAENLAKIAEAAKQNPEAALAQLEAKLKQSPPMQNALAEMTKDTAQAAEKALAEKANQPSFLGAAAEEAGHEIARVARHQARLNQAEAAKQAAEASEQLAATAKATKTEPGNATAEVAKAAQAAAQAAAKSAEQTAQKAPPVGQIPELEQAEGRDLAMALDQLDQMLHPAGSQQAQAQAGQQQSQQQQGQQAAQESLANAQQNMQQSMAQARAQGKVPGQSQQDPQTAQNQQGKPQQNDGQQSKEGGNFSQLVKAEDGTLVPISVILDADWGKLPTKMAEDLTEATRQEAAPEYRAAIENYYKAISARAKK